MPQTCLCSWLVTNPLIPVFQEANKNTHPISTMPRRRCKRISKSIHCSWSPNSNRINFQAQLESWRPETKPESIAGEFGTCQIGMEKWAISDIWLRNKQITHSQLKAMHNMRWVVYTKISNFSHSNKLAHSSPSEPLSLSNDQQQQQQQQHHHHHHQQHLHRLLNMAPCSDGYVHSQLIPAGTSGDPSAMVLLLCAILQNIAACAGCQFQHSQPANPITTGTSKSSNNPTPTTPSRVRLQPSIRPQVNLNLLHPIPSRGAEAAASSPPAPAWRAAAAGAGPGTPQGSREAASTTAENLGTWEPGASTCFNLKCQVATGGS